MRRSQLIAFVAVLGLGSSAFAQKEELFGDGKPPKFREEMLDKRFTKSKVAKLLKEGATDRGCVQLLGALFTTLAEVGPTLHKRDENFRLDPVLIDALNTQVSTPIFPATAYLTSMIRRIQIDQRMPDEWYETAKQLNKTVKIIDLAKLKLLTDGITYVDSAFFTIPLLKERYYAEVVNVNSGVTTDAAGSFRDAYLDRDVAWGGAILLDLGSNAPKDKKGKKKARDLGGTPGELVAILEWYPPNRRNTELDLLGTLPVNVPPVRIIAKLAARQFIDLEKVPKGARLMVRGRFWEMNKTVEEVEVRDALLFEDRDFGNGVLLANPNDIATCPAAINELTGVNPNQMGGFKH